MKKTQLSKLLTFILIFFCKLSFSQMIYDQWPTKETNDITRQKGYSKNSNITPNFVPIGRVWDHNIVTYFYQNGTDDISGNDERQAIRDAFSLWESATNLRFLEVCTAGEADIVFLWGTFNHGDPSPSCYPGLTSFDGINGTLAHSMGGPGPNDCGTQSGDIHFDDSETWSLNTQATGAQPIDLVTVAAHEIGHSLGLYHTNVTGSLMLANYTGSHRFLGTDDLAGIQSLYGTPNINSFITGPSQFCTTATYEVPNLPTGATVTWTATGGINVSGANNVNPVSVTKGISDTGILTANISTACGSFSISRNIGTPYIVYPIQHGAGTYQICAGSIINEFWVAESPDATNYSWSVSPVPYSYSISANGTRSIVLRINNAGSYTLKLAVTTPCGIKTTEVPITVLSKSSCGGLGLLSYHPNPADNTLTVEVAPESTAREILLYNDKGTAVRTVILQPEKSKIILDTKDLPSGNYFLHLTEGKETIKKQIIISH